jgi:hypothetical protein
MIYLILALIILAGIYSVMIVGITGGPNHGEHPLLVSLVHLGVFYFTAGSWPEGLHNQYMWLLVLCVVASIIGFGSADYTKVRIRFWIARGMLCIAYVGLILLFLSRHEII